MTQLAAYQKYSLSQSQSPIDLTDIPTVQGNSGQSIFGYGLKTVSLEVDGIYSITNAYRAALLARSEVILEINVDGSSKTVARGFFKPASRKQSGKVGALEDETVKFDLTVPSSTLLLTPFRWNFASTDLSMAVQICINAYINETSLYVKYLPDGGTTSNAGLTGTAIVSDMSLAGGITAMNEFSVSLQGTGAATAV
jgi:predicted secreted protein